MKSIKCSIQIVDLSGEKPANVVKMTYLMDGRDAQFAIEKALPRMLRVQKPVKSDADGNGARPKKARPKKARPKLTASQQGRLESEQPPPVIYE